MSINLVKNVLEDIKLGKFVIVVDDEDRENEGDLVMASQLITPEAVNFMVKEARGLICVSITEEKSKFLNLETMAKNNTSLHETNFTVSVDAAKNTTTGISTKDRCETIKVLANKTSNADDLVRPGHIFPIISKEGGILRRAGHTEASVDLAKMAGLEPCGVICEILSDDGSMARKKELEKFSKKHDIKIISISDLIKFRRSSEKLVKQVETVDLPTKYGEFKLHLFKDLFDGKEHIALSHGKIKNNQNILVRVHSECLTGDVFHSLRCDCGDQLEQAIKRISQEGSGVIVYLKQEGRGIGLMHKIKAYKLQEQGFDTVEANEKLGFPPDLRDYGVGAQILYSLGVRNLVVMTNNPMKLIGLEGHGLKIVDRVPLAIKPNPRNKTYLETKKSKLGHLID